MPGQGEAVCVLVVVLSPDESGRKQWQEVRANALPRIAYDDAVVPGSLKGTVMRPFME